MDKKLVEFCELLDIDWFEHDVQMSFYIIFEELAKKYYNTSSVTKEQTYHIMAVAMAQVAHDVDDDKFYDWKGNLYDKFASTLKSRANELDEDDDFYQIYDGYEDEE